jgi:hypothetical protein
MQGRDSVSAAERSVVICAPTAVGNTDMSTAVAIANTRVAERPVTLVIDSTHQAAMAHLRDGVSVLTLAAPTERHWFLCRELFDAHRIYRTLLAQNCDADAAELVFVGPASCAIEVVRARRLLGQFRGAALILMDGRAASDVLPGTVAEVFGRWAADYVRRHRDSVLPDGLPDVPARISVVIPLFNQGEYLHHAIASVRRESADAEIVVVNDGSTDQVTNATFGSLTGVVKVTQPNQGLAAARNAGINACSGDYVVPLDADDALYPGFLAGAHRALHGNPDMAYVVGHARLTGLINLTHLAAGFIPELSAFLHTHGRATGMFRKAVLDAVGGYDTNFSAFEDWDLQITLHRFGFQTDVLPVPSQYYHRHWDSMSFSVSNNIRHELIHQLMRKHVGMLDVDDLRTGMLVLAHMWKTGYEPSTSAALQRRMAEQSIDPGHNVVGTDS